MSATNTTSKPSLMAKLRYRFDNAMSRGPMIVIAYLALLSLLGMVITAVVAVIAQLSFPDESSNSFAEKLWQSMLRTLDPGTFSGDSGWPTRIVGLLITLLGLFLVASLIGLIASAVDQKVEELRRGHGPVIEQRHTLILGWSDQVPRIVSELVIANESEKDASVVVLARADKGEMEETLRDRVPDTKTTRLVCRNGDPSSPDDLERVAVARARSIVVVRDTDGDAGVVKAVLAVRALDPTLSRAHIVAELAERDNSRILSTISGGRVLTVSSEDVVAEVTAQASLQPGLAAIFSDLLDFDGDEIYFAAVPELSGKTYADALLGFDSCSVIGLMTGERTVTLNPKPDTAIGAGDELILVAADDSAIRFTGSAGAEVPEVQPETISPRAGMNLAIVGWSKFGAKVLHELDEFLPAGSAVDLLVDRDLVDPGELGGLEMSHATIRVHEGDGGPEDLRHMSMEGSPEQVIVLGYRDALSIDDADARSLLTLLVLRTIWPVGGDHRVRVVAELLDQKNLALAASVGVDDLIVSNALASLLMAQLSEHAELQAVFDDLFDAEGAAVELRAASRLVAATPMPFSAVVAASAARAASAFGYRLGSTGEVFVNPPKSKVVTLGPHDQVALVSGTAG